MADLKKYWLKTAKSFVLATDDLIVAVAQTAKAGRDMVIEWAESENFNVNAPRSRLRTLPRRLLKRQRLKRPLLKKQRLRKHLSRLLRRNRLPNLKQKQPMRQLRKSLRRQKNNTTVTAKPLSCSGERLF